MFSFTLSAKNRKRLVCLAKKAVEKKNSYRLYKGVCTSFIQFTESWGVKFSNRCDPYKMATIFKNQRRAWRFNLGPYCFGLFSCGDYTCYITKVEKVVSTLGEKFLIAKNWFCKEANRCSDILLKRIGFSFHDNHFNNIAIVNGNIICIDFGDE